jgi:hypothetical protein
MLLLFKLSEEIFVRRLLLSDDKREWLSELSSGLIISISFKKPWLLLFRKFGWEWIKKLFEFLAIHKILPF